MKYLLVAAGVLAASVGRPLAEQAPPAACRAAAPAVSREPNIFTPAQESDLGDAVAERYEPFIGVIEDPDLTAPLQRIGDRLIRHLPPTALRITFRLMDIPDANAFVLPGGRIYVSRKLIGFTRTEDELAGVLGHELGHLIARQQTIEMTRRFKEVIGVTEVGDRRDIFEKFNRLTDNAARKPGAFRSDSREDGDQIEADRIGLFAVAAAGYDPQAHVKLFDRISGTEGRTGSFLSKMLGSTNPDARRLGEMMKNLATVPAGCAEPRTQADVAVYEDWQASVLSFSGLGRTESVHGLLAKTRLTPALRGEVTHLRFSPDGRLAIAQDEASISVLSRDPLAVLFHIDAPDAEPAQFTPDSRDVVFHTMGLRVERWEVAEHKLVEVHDIVWRTACRETSLSPDGKTLACLDTSFDLWLIDVASATSLFQKKNFYSPNAARHLLEQYGVLVVPATDHVVTMRFSPDGRFFVSGYRDIDQGTMLAYDVRAHAPITVKNPGRKLLTATFTFIGPDRLLGLNPDDPARSGIVRLPSGDVMDTMALIPGALDAATNPNYVMVRPIEQYAVGLFDLRTKSITKGSANDAVDVFEQFYIAEQGTGDVGLYPMTGDKAIAKAALPAGELGRISALAVSDDLKWLAVSESSRGAVWDLVAGQRVAYIRGFRGGYFDDTGVFFADWPSAGADPRAVLRLRPAAREIGSAGEIKDRLASQNGRWMLVTRTVPENVMYPSGVTYELRDIRLPAPIWTRAYPKDPPDAWVHPGSDSVVFSWDAASPAGREAIRKDPDLRASVNLSDIQGDYVLEIVGAETGQLKKRMLLETGKGSFHISEISTAGDWLCISDSIGRVLVYSLKTGELKGHAVGFEPAVNLSTGVLAVNAGGGRLVLYDLDTMRRRDDYTFTHPIVLTAFSAIGTRLFVLTSDQTAFVLEPGR
jgi:WD40 repeat protein